jgi:hypothetical protein
MMALSISCNNTTTPRIIAEQHSLLLIDLGLIIQTRINQPFSFFHSSSSNNNPNNPNNNSKNSNSDSSSPSLRLYQHISRPHHHNTNINRLNPLLLSHFCRSLEARHSETALYQASIIRHTTPPLPIHSTPH